MVSDKLESALVFSSSVISLMHYATKEYGKEEILSLLDPIVAEWFSKYPDITPPQRYAIAHIHRGENVLIASPTGSGKTLAAMLAIISELFKLAREGELENKVYCVYVSPLRALNYDISKNLLEPLKEIVELAKQKDIEAQEIRVSVRTGDTTPSERSRMLREAPHILITTPESLAIMLCAPKFKEKLRGVKWVIVDEIHEMCNSKRGVHLTLSLERLERLAGKPLTRIGLSATIHPLDQVALFLCGYNDDGTPRECTIVDARFVKKMDLRVYCPVEDLVHTSASETSEAFYKMLEKIIKSHKTTLIFTNTRSGTERVVYHLSKLNVVDGDELAAHHSSLSREIRREVEDKLKEGKMRAVVTSTSLELGIDIGSIDVVVQVGSPKSISRCLQRIGRAGHTLDKVSKGVLIAMERDDLVEDAVMVREAYAGRIDKVSIPMKPLDVLAQHVVGLALEKKWKVEEAYALVRRSYCYRDLTLEEFKSVLRYLSGQHNLESYKVYGKIWYDENEGVFGRRGALLRPIYAQNVGTIPDEVAVRVLTLEGRWVGMIEEEFLERLSKGDVFILGGKTYEFQYAKGLKAYVRPAEHVKPTVPSWFSEMLPLSFDLGEAISKFRGEVFSMLDRGASKDEVVSFIMRECHADYKAANSIYEYFKAQKSFLDMLGIGERHSRENILVENYIDEEGKQNIIFHAVFGRRVNDALSRAYAYVLGLRIKRNIMVTVGDSGFILTLPSGVRVDVENLLNSLRSSEIRGVLSEAVRKTELVRRRFRHCATRALMVLRNYKGHEVKVARQQMNAQVLLSVVEDIPDFPVLKEAIREVLEDVMDVNNAINVLRNIELRMRRFVILPAYDLPSPFAHDLLLIGMSDVVLMEDRKELLKRLYDEVMARAREKGVA